MGQSSTKAGVVVWGSSEHGQLGLGVTEHMVTAWLGVSRLACDFSAFLDAACMWYR